MDSLRGGHACAKMTEGEIHGNDINIAIKVCLTMVLNVLYFCLNYVAILAQK